VECSGHDRGTQEPRRKISGKPTEEKSQAAQQLPHQTSDVAAEYPQMALAGRWRISWIA